MVKPYTQTCIVCKMYKTGEHGNVVFHMIKFRQQEGRYDRQL